MDLFHVACETSNKYLGADFFETVEEAQSSKTECGVKDCKCKIIVYP